MINKNDLRYIKTERLIEDTYFQLKRKTVKPIKVSELCEKAMINKTTFYTHYETMEELHRHICKKAIEQFLNNCPYVDSVFTDTPSFVRAIVKTIEDNSKLSKVLFGNDNTQQTNYFESCLLKRYLHGSETGEMEMKIKFAIGGAARLLLENQSEERIQMTINLITKVL